MKTNLTITTNMMTMASVLNLFLSASPIDVVQKPIDDDDDDTFRSDSKAQNTQERQ